MPRPYRLLNRDGSFNIQDITRRKHSAFRNVHDLYHRMLRWSHLQFFGAVAALYLTLNVLFGMLYFWTGPEGLEGSNVKTTGSFLSDCFFFSVQTLATIGYGRISPVSLTANLLVTLESLTGILCIALITGILFARFSRPTARVIFSRVATLSMIDGVRCLCFRLANERLNQIAEARLSVSLVMNETTKEGHQFRNFHELKLERNYSPVFAISWLVVHEIDATSPLYNMTFEKLRHADIEIFATLTGIDDTFGQSIHARYSYITDDLRENESFVDILKRSKDGKLQMNLGPFHETVADTIHA